jgi:SHS2 domain-containing protein
MVRMYEEIEHTADLAIKVTAPSLSGLLLEAALAVMELSGIALGDANQTQESITLNADDPETLMVSWLEELLYAIEVNQLGYKACQVEISAEFQLQATVSLAPITSLQRLIKAVTFHELSIEKVRGGYETIIVFDV